MSFEWSNIEARRAFSLELSATRQPPQQLVAINSMSSLQARASDVFLRVVSWFGAERLRWVANNSPSPCLPSCPERSLNNPWHQISNMLGETSSRQKDSSGSCRPGSSTGARVGRTSPTSSIPSGAPSKSAPDHRTSFARDVLERLVLSNTKAYASRKQVSNAMREVQQVRERGADVARVKAGEGSGGDAGGGAASCSVAGDESRGLESSDESKGQQRVKKGKGGGDEQDLGSRKRREEEVLSVTR